MEFDVDVDIHATLRIPAKSEEDALDMVEAYADLVGNGKINSIYPLWAVEV